MPRKRRRKPVGSESADRELSASDQAIERGIDAIDWLRTEMRRSGMIACADALDEAFVKCLHDYVSRKQDATPEDLADGAAPQGKKLN